MKIKYVIPASEDQSRAVKDMVRVRDNIPNDLTERALKLGWIPIIESYDEEVGFYEYAIERVEDRGFSYVHMTVEGVWIRLRHIRDHDLRLKFRKGRVQAITAHEKLQAILLN